MMGSASLDWPDERENELGLTLVLIERAAADPDWFLNFAHHWYYSGSKLIAGIRKVTTNVLIPFVRDYGDYVRSQRRQVPSSTSMLEAALATESPRRLRSASNASARHAGGGQGSYSRYRRMAGYWCTNGSLTPVSQELQVFESTSTILAAWCLW